MIARKDFTPGLGVSLQNKAKVYTEANDFCKQQGLKVETLNLEVTPSLPAQFGSTELRFKCIELKNSALPHIREADKIIEIRNR